MKFPFHDLVNRITSATCPSSFPKQIWQANLPSLLVILSISLFVSLTDPTERAPYKGSNKETRTNLFDITVFTINYERYFPLE